MIQTLYYHIQMSATQECFTDDFDERWCDTRTSHDND